VYDIDSGGYLLAKKEFRLSDTSIDINPKNKFITDISFSYNGKLIMIASEGGLEIYKLSRNEAEFLNYTDVMKGKNISDA